MNIRSFAMTSFVLLTLALSLGSWTQEPWSQEKSGPQQYEQTFPEERHLIESLNGQLLYQAYCATCHGMDARGNGPVAQELKKRPSDLTLIRRRNGGTFPILRVQTIISGENSPTAAHGDREMPIWGPIFSQIAWDQDLGNVRIYNLAKYLESLQRK